MIEEKSKEYGDSYIKNSNLYPLINDHRRKQLITVDVYQMEESFEDGAVWMLNDIVTKTIDWMKSIIYQEYPGSPIERIITDDMIEEYKKVIDYEGKTFGN